MSAGAYRPEPLDQAQQALEDALLELRSFAIVAEQLDPERSGYTAELEQVRWPWLVGRMSRRVEDALSTYFDQVVLLRRAIRQDKSAGRS